MKKKKLLNWNRISGFLFLLPALAVVIGLLLYPVLSSVFYSFTSKHLIKQNYKFVGIDNYIKILSDKEFTGAFLTSIKWTVFSLLGQIGVGFTAALALNRIKKGQVCSGQHLLFHGHSPLLLLHLHGNGF